MGHNTKPSATRHDQSLTNMHFFFLSFFLSFFLLVVLVLLLLLLLLVSLRES